MARVRASFVLGAAPVTVAAAMLSQQALYEWLVMSRLAGIPACLGLSGDESGNSQSVSARCRHDARHHRPSLSLARADEVIE